MNTILVCSYNKFNNLAHKVKGYMSSNPISIIQNNNYSTTDIQCENPAFAIRRGKYIYVCCESINEGTILTIDSETRKILKSVSSCGKSSCYLQIDPDDKYIININYWDSIISVHPIVDNILQEASQIIIPKNENKIVTQEDHLFDRQKTSHHHSCAFYNGDLYVPDLGTDRIDIYSYVSGNLKFKEFIQLPRRSGPRYIIFRNDHLYVINELSSSISVIDMNPIPNTIQKISTIPENTNVKNTCGTIQYSKLGYIYASNRGHNSIAIFKIMDNNLLERQSNQNTFGKTPRHFQINEDCSNLYVANQDTNEIVTFRIEDNQLKIENVINCNSPNFILCLND